MEPVSNVAGLYRLSLNATRQFDVRNLVVAGTDVTIDMAAGTAFVAEIPDRPDRYRSSWARTPEICAAGSSRAHADPALYRRRRLAVGVRRRVPAAPAVGFRSQVSRRIARPASRRADRPAARHGCLRRVPLTHAPDRSDRPEPRPLVPRPFVGRPDCRGAHATIWQPHLRAVWQRGRGHHGLRSPAEAQHLHLRLGSEARGARTLLQRGRPGRLRCPRLRGRCRVLAGTLLDQRHRAPARQGPRERDDHHDAEARRGLHGPRCVRAGLRAAASPARRQPEQPHREPAVAGLSRQRVHADHCLQRPARAGRARSRGDRRGDAATGARTVPDPARGAIHLQQQLVLVSAVDGQRLRARHAADHGADRLRRGGDRHVDWAVKARRRDRQRRGADAEDVPLPERPAGPLSLVRDQPHVAGRVHAAADQGLGRRLRRSSRRRARSVAAGSRSAIPLARGR